MGLIELVLLVGAALVAIGVVVALVRDVRPGSRLLLALAALEVGMLVHLVAGIVHFARDGHGVSAVTYIGYLVVAALVLPIAWVWSDAERNRGGTAVLLIGLVLIPFLFLRVGQVWSAGG